MTYLDFVRDGKVYSAFADGDSADEVLQNAYGYQLIDADGNVVSAEEACNKAGAYRIVPIAKLKVDENNWGSKYEIIEEPKARSRCSTRLRRISPTWTTTPGTRPASTSVAGRGLMKGYEGTTIFGVGSALTRGELATIPGATPARRGCLLRPLGRQGHHGHRGLRGRHVLHRRRELGGRQGRHQGHRAPGRRASTSPPTSP